MPSPTQRASAGDGDQKATRLTVSVAEAATLLGIDRASTYQCVRSCQIPSIRLGGRIVVPIRAWERLTGIDDSNAA